MAKSQRAKQVFFAGEATALANHGSLPDSWMSGQRAAAAATRAL